MEVEVDAVRGDGHEYGHIAVRLLEGLLASAWAKLDTFHLSAHTSDIWVGRLKTQPLER